MIAAADSGMRTLGDLHAFWEHSKEPVAEHVLRSLCQIIHPVSPPGDYVVIPANTGGVGLRGYPLRRATRYWLDRAGLFARRDDVTVGALLGAPRIGRIKLIEVMCVAELARSLSEFPGVDSHPVSEDTSGASATVGNSRSYPGQWAPLLHAVGSLLAAAREFRGADTVADALREDLSGIARILGVSRDLDALEIRNLVGDQRMADTVIAQLDAMVASLSPSLKYVIDHRILSDRPKTFDEIGRKRHLSRERVRQLQVNVERKIRHAVGREIDIIGRMIAGSFQPVAHAQSIRDAVSQIFPSSEPARLSVRLARRWLTRKLGYSCQDGTCFDSAARNLIAALRTKSRKVADGVGLVEEALLRPLLPDHTWEPFFETLVQHAGLHRVGQCLARRVTTSVRIKAAIVEIGQPAPAEQIAVTAGMSLKRVATRLSSVPGMARADKTRWGLAVWIDDPYESIRAAMVERIQRNDGKVELSYLLEELPQRFGVSESSVRAYSRTPFFSLDEGYVSIARDPLRGLRNLDDVVTGRTPEGHPYWTFTVDDSHFAGYSISRVPPELAVAVGCQPDGRTVAEVDFPHEAGTVSVNWRLTSNYGATVGRAREALQMIGAKPGDRVRLLLNARQHIEFRLAPAGGPRV